MKRLVLVALMYSPVVVVLAGAPGCGNACDDLADICGDCTDADYQASCEATVTDANQEVCSIRLDELRPICVGEEPTTSSSAGGPAGVGSGGNGGSTTGAAGTGGSGASGGSGGSVTSTGGAGGTGGSASGAGGTGGA